MNPSDPKTAPDGKAKATPPATADRNAAPPGGDGKPPAGDGKPPVTTPPASNVEAAPHVTPMRTRRVLIVAVIAAIVLAALLVLGILPRRSMQKTLNSDVASAMSAVPVIAVSKAERRTTPTTLLLPATMEALHETAIYARVSGYVRQWHTDIGSTVRAGQLLAEIYVPELDQQVLQARAQLAQARSMLVLARANLERWRFLFADGAVTVQELQQMQQAYDAATASVHAAEAFLASLVSTQRYTRVRAPFDGVVTARSVDNGSLISTTGASSTPLTAGGSQLAQPTTISAASLFRIAQTDTVRVYVSIPEPYVASIHPGLTAELIIELGGRSFPGRVVRSARAVDQTSRTLLTEVDVPNPTGVLLAGMYAQVRITLHRTAEPLMIPSTALIARAGGPQVIELIPSGSGQATVHLRNVQVARDYGSTLEIVAGLNDGALVATIGAQILTDGQKVRIATSTAGSTGVNAVTPPKSGG